MIANYHTHTFRCGHAEGNEREYVEQAVDKGLKILGFSDHTPYDFFDAEPRNRPMRMKPEELPQYAESLRALAREYEGRIRIFAGVEAEYYPKYFPRLLELLRANGIQYMILGQHYLGNEIGEAHWGRGTRDETILERYVSQCVEALGTGLFSYVAHPDLVRFTGDGAAYDAQMRRLCRACSESKTPLEINLLGLKSGKHYPNEHFWRIAGEEGNVAVLGCDAHRPEDVLEREAEASALRLAERCGIPVLQTVTLRAI